MTPPTNAAHAMGTGGQWLFKQDELVLGPMPAEQVIDRLYRGEIDGRTEVCPVGESAFRRISEVDYFKVALAKAEAKQRVEAKAKQDELKNSRSRNVKIALVAMAALALAVAVVPVFRYLAVQRPWQELDDDYSFDIEAPTVTPVRKSRHHEEELIAYPGMVPGRGAAGADRSGSKAAAPQKHAVPAGGKKGMRLNDETEEPDGLQMAKFDQEAINGVVRKHQAKLAGCLKEAWQKRQVAGKIPVEFVIGNNGKVSKVWVDHPSYKDGPLPGCLLRELQSWPFKPYEGEQATVGLAFNIGKR